MDMRCLKCGYDLSQLTEHRCPECGRAFDPKDPTTFVPEFQIRRPTTWDALRIFVWPFVVLTGMTLVLPSARSNLDAGFDSTRDLVIYASGLILAISAAFTVIVWIFWFVIWLMCRSQD